MPRVMNVDKNPAYPAAVDALKADGSIPRRVRLGQCELQTLNLPMSTVIDACRPCSENLPVG